MGIEPCAAGPPARTPACPGVAPRCCKKTGWSRQRRPCFAPMRGGRRRPHYRRPVLRAGPCSPARPFLPDEACADPLRRPSAGGPARVPAARKVRRLQGMPGGAFHAAQGAGSPQLKPPHISAAGPGRRPPNGAAGRRALGRGSSGGGRPFRAFAPGRQRGGSGISQNMATYIPFIPRTFFRYNDILH